MTEIGAFEAKTHFSALLERAERGEEILITRRGKPVAKIVPVRPAHDPEQVRAALDRLRAMAKTAGLKPPTPEELKEWREEGRP
ncbi:MAG: type II toxin-antitoxin system prevent-host-death family antitoxin [Alphaproteobacteria bacterium]